jgi:hypothetical protein
MPAEPANPTATPGPGTAQQSWHAPAPCCHTAHPRKTSSKCQAALRQDGELLTAATLAAGSRQSPASDLGPHDTLVEFANVVAVGRVHDH